MKSYTKVIHKMYLNGLAICSLFLLIACESDPTGSNISNGDLIPLNVDNIWKFERTYFDTLGNELLTDRDSILIISDTLIDGIKWFCRNFYGHTLAYRNVSEGIRTRLISTQTSSTFLNYKYPAQVGNIFRYPVVYFSGDQAWMVDSTHLASVISNDTTIVVPAGDFQCYHYRVTDLSNDNYWQDEFISPGNGWIKTDTYFRKRIGNRQEYFKANSNELTSVRLNE